MGKTKYIFFTTDPNWHKCLQSNKDTHLMTTKKYWIKFGMYFTRATQNLHYHWLQGCTFFQFCVHWQSVCTRLCSSAVVLCSQMEPITPNKETTTLATREGYWTLGINQSDTMYLNVTQEIDYSDSLYHHLTLRINQSNPQNTGNWLIWQDMT